MDEYAREVKFGGGPLAALGSALTGLRKKRKIPHDPLSYLPCKPKVGVKFRAYCSTMEQWGTTGVVLSTIGDDTFLTEKKGEQQLVRLEGKPSDDYADLAEKDSFPATGKHVFDTIRKQRAEGLAEDRKKSLPEPTAAEDTRTAAVAATSGSAAHTDRTAQPRRRESQRVSRRLSMARSWMHGDGSSSPAPRAGRRLDRATRLPSEQSSFLSRKESSCRQAAT